MDEKRIIKTKDGDPEKNEEYSLPPRSTLFPSEKDRLTRWFYQSLFVIFLLLIVILTSYGMIIRD